MIHFDNHRISLLIALRGIGNHLLTEKGKKNEHRTCEFCALLRTFVEWHSEKILTIQTTQDERKISANHGGKRMSSIYSSTLYVLLLPHCLLSVRQITLVPSNGHPSFKKMIIKVQGARRDV